MNFFDLWAAGHLLKDDKLESLGKMLRGYCFVDMDKILWDTRPMDAEMLKSARIRSHYLLYLHEVIRNNLIEKNLLDQVYTQCRGFCQASTVEGKIMCFFSLNCKDTLTKLAWVALVKIAGRHSLNHSPSFLFRYLERFAGSLVYLPSNCIISAILRSLSLRCY